METAFELNCSIYMSVIQQQELQEQPQQLLF